MKAKRSKKILDQLIAEASNGNFNAEKVLYIKEAQRYRTYGFAVERVFSKELDSPNRNSFLYKISWEDVSDETSLAKSLFYLATEAVENP